MFNFNFKFPLFGRNKVVVDNKKAGFNYAKKEMAEFKHSATAETVEQFKEEEALRISELRRKYYNAMIPESEVEFARGVIESLNIYYPEYF